MADSQVKTANLLNNSNFEQGGWDAAAGTIPDKNSNSKRCRYSEFFSISSTIVYYDFKDLNANIIMVDSNGISLGGSGFKTGTGSFALLNNTDKISLIIANTDTTQNITPEEVQSKNISLDYGWVHSLRKLCSATETIQSGDTIYANGQPITTYTLKGNEEHTGTPSPQNPVMPQGTGNKTANLLSGWTKGQRLDPSTGVARTDIAEACTTDYIAVDKTKNYIAKPLYLNYSSFVAAYNASKQFLGRTSATQRSSVTFDSTSFTSGTPQGTGDIAYIRITIYNAGSQTGDIDDAIAMETMMNEGNTVLPYEPYGYKIPILKDSQALTPIYLNEPLLKIGDYEDTLNSDGTVTRRIGKIDLGTRTYTKTSSGNFYFSSALSNVRIISNADTGNGLCTHFAEVTPQVYASTPYSFCTCINMQAIACFNATGFEGYTTEQFQEAMSGVYMYYVLATPTTETVTAPSIPTTDGANSISVDTTVQPSEFTATWTGWHDSSVKEYDGSDWQ